MSKFFEEIDIQFVKECMKDSLFALKTQITVAHLNDAIAKVVFSLLVKNINEKGVFIPIVDLQILFADEERLEKIAVLQHPHKLTNATDLINYINGFNTEVQVKSLEKTIIERYTRYRLSIVNKDMYNDLDDSTKSIKEILRKASFKIDNLLTNTAEDREIVTCNDIFQQETNYMNSPREADFPTTGWIIDEANGGLNSPSVSVICALPKAGKSLSLYQATLNSLQQKRTVLFCTIEIPSKECTRKILSSYSQISYMKINKKELDSEEQQLYSNSVKEFSENFKDKFYVMYDLNGISCKDIEIFVKNLERAGIIIEDIVIDYTLLMKSNSPNVAKVEALGNIPAELRQLSQRTNTRIFTACQLGSKASEKTIEDLTFDDIYYMKNLSHEVTYTILLTHDKDKNNKSDIKMAFLPSRQLWTTTVYRFPDYNPDTLTLGKPIEVDDFEEIDSNFNIKEATYIW